MNKPYIYLFLLYLFFISCSDSQNELRRDLTNNNFKYWYRYNKDSLKPYSLGYCFFSNGTFIRYYNPDYNKSIRRVNDMPPVYSNPIWKLINDTTIMIGDKNYFKIIFLNTDSVILKSSESNDYLKLHRDKDQITMPVK